MAKTVTVEKKVLNSALKGFIKRLEKAESFVLAEAPDICKQMVAARKIEMTEQGCGALFFLIVGLVLLSMALPNEIIHAGSYGSDPTRWFFVMILGAISFLIGFFMGLDCISNLRYLRNCTKLFLLKEFKKLVK